MKPLSTMPTVSTGKRLQRESNPSHNRINNHWYNLLLAVLIASPSIVSTLWQREWLLLAASIAVLVVVYGICDFFIPQVRPRRDRQSIETSGSTAFTDSAEPTGQSRHRAIQTPADYVADRRIARIRNAAHISGVEAMAIPVVSASPPGMSPSGVLPSRPSPNALSQHIITQHMARHMASQPIIIQRAAAQLIVVQQAVARRIVAQRIAQPIFHQSPQAPSTV